MIARDAPPGLMVRITRPGPNVRDRTPVSPGCSRRRQSARSPSSERFRCCGHLRVAPQRDLRMPWLGRPFVGLANCREAMADARFWSALAHTAAFTAGTVTLELLLGLALSLALNHVRSGIGVIRTATLLPWAIPTVVAALVWRFMFESPNGIVNYTLLGSGAFHAAPEWFSDPRAAWVPIVLADVWKATPFMALLLLAGLQNIDPTLYQAAALDGAGPLRQTIEITSAASSAGHAGGGRVSEPRRVSCVRPRVRDDERRAGHRHRAVCRCTRSRCCFAACGLAMERHSRCLCFSPASF